MDEIVERSAATAAGPVPGRPLLEVADLTAGHGTHQVLDGVGLTVPPGAFVGLLGHNGAGKTTLLQAITGHLRASRGTVTLDGRDITAMQPAEIAQAGVGYVPQGQAVFASLTVRENISVGGAMQSDAAARREREDFVFEQFPILKERLSQKAGSLSGGQRQMLAIAMSLIGGPRVMLMDEPSTGLAPVLASEVLAACKRINSELGTALVVVEPEIKRILDLADRIHVLQLGSMVFDGTAEELRKQPLSELF